jgi:hypothetical protein
MVIKSAEKKIPAIQEAKAIAKRIGADAVVVLAFKGDVVSGASYGQTKAHCAIAGKWMGGLIDDMEAGYVLAPALPAK